MTKEQMDDLKLLSMVNDKLKFSVEIGYTAWGQSGQDAFERGIDHQYFTLVDVGYIAAAPGRVMRTFRLTQDGARRLGDLRDAVAIERMVFR